jgi:hypothetical protein
MPLILVLEPKSPHVRVAEIRFGSPEEQRRLMRLWRRVSSTIEAPPVL